MKLGGGEKFVWYPLMESTTMKGDTYNNPPGLIHREEKATSNHQERAREQSIHLIVNITLILLFRGMNNALVFYSIIK